MPQTVTAATLEAALDAVGNACDALGVPAVGPDHLEALLTCLHQPHLLPLDVVRAAYALTD